MKKIRAIILCFLCSIICYGGTVQAQSAKSAYTVKDGNYLNNAKLTVKGSKTNKITLNIKKRGTLNVSLNNGESLKGKEQIKVKLVDSKGKTIKTSYGKKGRVAYISTNVTKGTYEIVVTTKNIKKNAKRIVNIGYTLNQATTLNANNKSIYNVLDAKGKTTVKLINDRNQVVIVKANGSYNTEEGKITVKDSKGAMLFTDRSNKATAWQYYYLAKGTYSLTYEGSKNATVSLCVEPFAKYSNNLNSTAMSHEEAIQYKDEPVQLAYQVTSMPVNKMWIKVDTTGKDQVLSIKRLVKDQQGDDCDMVLSDIYKEDGTVVELEKETDITLLKDTGSYYIGARVYSNRVVCVTPREINGVVELEGERTVLCNNKAQKYVPATSNQVIKGTIELKEDSYLKMALYQGYEETDFTIYDAQGKQVVQDTEGVARLTAGTYSIENRLNSKESNASYSIDLYKCKKMTQENIVYTSGKSETVVLPKLEANKLYWFDTSGAISDKFDGSIDIYENNKKIACISGNGSRIYFPTKANKTYKAVIKTSYEQLLEYGVVMLESNYKIANSELTSKKSSAKQYNMPDKKAVMKEVSILGNYSGWMKVKNSSKKKTEIKVDAYVNQGEAIVAVYNSKGILKKKMNLSVRNHQVSCKLAGNQAYSVRIYSTNKNTSISSSVSFSMK